MKHIVADPSTRENLEQWSGGKQLVMLSHSFWRPGVELQSSTTGLLRSILHQICRNSQTAMGSVLTFVEDRPRIWTDSCLVTAIMQAITKANECFCLFIDGLDECHGNLNEIADLIVDLQRSNNIKACVSSRPDRSFDTKFPQYKQMRLEDLNWLDLMRFVEAKLEPYHMKEKDFLIPEVVDRASGVFLWAALVTEALATGAQNCDTSQELRDLLKDMPPEMEDLFSLMLNRIDKRYRTSFKFYLMLLKYNEKFGRGLSSFLVSVPYITSMQTQAESMSSEAFVRECEDVEVSISSRSAGLFEVRQRDYPCPDPNDAKSWASAYYRSAAPSLQTVNESDLESGDKWREAARERTKIEAGEEYPSWLWCEGHELNWVHRSAYDFSITHPELSKGRFEVKQLRELETILTGTLRYIAFAPSYGEGNEQLESQISTGERLFFVLNTIRSMYEPYPDLVSKFLDRAYDLIVYVPSEEFKTEPCSILAYAEVSSFLSSTAAFWATCLRSAQYKLERENKRTLIDYINARFDRWAVDLGGKCLIHPLESEALRYFMFHPKAGIPFLQNPTGHPAYEQFALAILDCVLGRMDPTKYAKREPHNFLRDNKRTPKSLELSNIIDWELCSISCFWPTDISSDEFSSGDALSLFLLMGMYLPLIEREHELPASYTRVWSALNRLIEVLEPTCNVVFRTRSTRTPEHRQIWMHIQIPFVLWRAIIKHATDQAAVDDQFWHSSHLRFVCYPKAEQRAAEEWHPRNHLLPFSECKIDVEIEPSESIKVNVFQILMESVHRGPSGDFHIELNDDQEERFLDALNALAQYVKENKQGLDPTEHQLAVTCVEKEIFEFQEERRLKRKDEFETE